jgi:hypothetical protein
MPKVRTYEEHQKAIVHFKEEAEKQRPMVEKLRAHALDAARRSGVPAEMVDAGETEILLLPPGRDYNAFIEARKRLLKAKAIVGAIELSAAKLRLEQTLPPKHPDQ